MTMRELFKSNPLSNVPVLRGENPLRQLRQDMDALLENFFGETSWPSRWARSENACSVCVDIAETDKEYKITAEIPGMDAKDIRVSVAEGYVTLKGVKEEKSKEEKPGYFRQERAYGEFKRVIGLPEAANLDKAEATINKGILTVVIPKKAGATAKERTLEIKHAA